MSEFFKSNAIFSLISIMIGALLGFSSKTFAEDKPSTQPDYLNPEIIDKGFDEIIGKKIESVVGNNKIQIPYIPYYDDFYDEFGKVSPFDFTLGFTLANMYLWRGQNLGSNTSWMPYVTVSPDFEPIGDISFTYWVDITQHHPGRHDETYGGFNFILKF